MDHIKVKLRNKSQDLKISAVSEQFKLQSVGVTLNLNCQQGVYTATDVDKNHSILCPQNIISKKIDGENKNVQSHDQYKNVKDK